MHLKTLQFCEALNKPYDWKGTGKYSAYFITDSGNRIEVRMYEHVPVYLDPNMENEIPVHLLEFYMDDKDYGFLYDMTKTGDAFRVMATVLDIVKRMYMNNKSEIINLGFSSSKKGGRDSGRTKVYRRLFKKFTPPGSWEKIEVNNNHDTYFIYKKK